MTVLPDANVKQANRIDLVLVDDEELTLEAVSWFLRKTELSFQVFLEPNVALKTLRKNIPYSLIVDYYMPLINGIDFLAEFSQVSGSESCSLYLCSDISLNFAMQSVIDELGVQVLDKSVLYDKSSLLGLLTAPCGSCNR